MKRKRAKEHHEKHGDMHGKTCLLAECSIHYPKRRTAYIRSGRRIIEMRVSSYDPKRGQP